MVWINICGFDKFDIQLLLKSAEHVDIAEADIFFFLYGHIFSFVFLNSNISTWNITMQFQTYLRLLPNSTELF